MDVKFENIVKKSLQLVEQNYVYVAQVSESHQIIEIFYIDCSQYL